MVPGGGELKVCWAMSLLEDGVESESLAILATLQQFINEFEADQYFSKVLSELSITKPPIEEAIGGFVKVIAQEVINGELDPLEGVAYFDRINSEMDYPKYLSQYVSLADEWYSEHIDGLSIEQRRQKIVESCRETYHAMQYPSIFSV